MPMIQFLCATQFHRKYCSFSAGFFKAQVQYSLEKNMRFLGFYSLSVSHIKVLKQPPFPLLQDMVVKLAEEKRALERFVFSLASYHKVTQVFDFCKGMNVIELNYHDMMGISSLKKATLKCIFMQLLLGNHHESSISDAAFGGYFSCTGTEEG